MDRASAFADPEVLALVRDRFVPVALDVWYAERAASDSGRLFRAIVAQREGMVPGRSTQGFYAVTAAGTLLEGWNHRHADRMLLHLRRALGREKAAAPPAIPDAKDDRRFDRSLPAGAVVVQAFARIVDADWPEKEGEFDAVFRSSTGRDRLWILAEEVEALGRGRFPDRLLRRIARFHLVDDTRGEPPHWAEGEVLQASATLERAGAGWDLRGSVRLATAETDRSYDATLRGRVETRAGRIVRFDAVAVGPFRGEGRYTKGAPPGEFRLALAFRLAPDDDEFRSVPPQGARDVAGYLGR